MRKMNLLVLVLLSTPGFLYRSSSAQEPQPYATLTEAAPLELPGEVDSNSPVLWAKELGLSRMYITTSSGGWPSVASGARLTRMMGLSPVEFVRSPEHGVWMEAIVADESGTWYGYYHNEIPAALCGRLDLVMPRIGAARSTDRGRTWRDLGIVLEAPPGAHECSTPNRYFVGGVGDLSVMLDHDAKYLYLFFSQYSRSPAAQGVAVGRFPWAFRDEPIGQVDVWSRGAWLPALSVLEGPADRRRVAWRYPAGTPLVTPSHPWHDDDPVSDAFWGAAVHWNTSLQQYVMLLNRTVDEEFGQEGIYVSFARRLDDPALWSAPQKILPGGNWYPQVVGLDYGRGTDKVAGRRARFFMSGRSTHYIEFGYR